MKYTYMTKEEIISLKIDREAKAKFKNICEAKFSNVSREIQIFIYNTIKFHENDKTEINKEL